MSKKLRECAYCGREIESDERVYRNELGETVCRDCNAGRPKFKDIERDVLGPGW